MSAYPQPFRTSRPVGTPSTGGNSFTLASHIGSHNAHPSYQKKGEETGGFDIGEHESNVNAHRTHYLRRLELAYLIEHFNNPQNQEPSNYIAGSTKLDTAFNPVVTVALLKTLFDNGSLYIGDIFSWRHLITVYTPESVDSQGTLIPEHPVAADGTDLTGKPIGTTLDTKNTNMYAPGWSVFFELYKFAHSMTNSNPEINELMKCNLFALKNHTHNYAPIDHTHPNWQSLMDADGNIPAKANHTHDDLYWRRDEDIGVEVVLEPFRRTGIYPKTVIVNPIESERGGASQDKDPRSVEEGGIRSINRRNVQGNMTYVFDDTMLDEMQAGGLPSEIVERIQEKSSEGKSITVPSDTTATLTSAENIKYSVILSVLRGETDTTQFGHDRLDQMLAKAPLTNAMHQVASQVLMVNAGIFGLDRSGESLVDRIRNYRDTVYQMYWRNGFALESAWYIRSVLSTIGLTAGSFLDLINQSDDPIQLIADTVNDHLSGDLDTDLANGLIAGVYRPDPTRRVRASVPVWQCADDYTVSKTERNSTMELSEIVAHDVSRWLIPGVFQAIDGGTVDPSDPSGYSELNKLCISALHDRLLPYQRYYTRAEKLTKVNVTGSLVPIDESKRYFLRNGSSYEEIELDKSDLTTDDIPSTSTGIRYPVVDGNVVHHLFVRTWDPVYISGRTYYIPDGKDTYGNTAFTEFHGTPGSPIDGNIYVRVSVTLNGKYVWSKTPVIRAHQTTSGDWEGTSLDDFDGNDRFYYFDTDPNSEDYLKFVSVGTKNDLYNMRPDHLVPCEYDDAVFKNPIFIDLSIYTRAVGSITIEPSSTKEIKVETANVPFLKSVSYTNTIVRAGDEILRTVVLVEEGDPRYGHDTDEYKYVLIGSKIPVPTATEWYSVSLPKYTYDAGGVETEYEINDPDHPVYCAAYFFKTTDTSKNAVKNYFTRDVDGVFVKFVGESFEPNVDYFESVDMEKFFDVWCAIKQLTTTGSEDVRGVGAGYEPIVYHIGEDGELIAWNEWCRQITDKDDAARWAHKHDNGSVLDLFTYDPREGQLYFNGNKITTSASSHSHGNKETVLDQLGVADEGAGSTALRRLTFHDTIKNVDYRVAYIEDIDPVLKAFEKIEPSLAVISRFTFSGDGHVVVDGTKKIPFASDIHTHDNKDVLDQVTQDLIDNEHWHTNNEETGVLDKLGVSASGGLTFNGIEIGALAATYEVSLVAKTDIASLLNAGTIVLSVAQINAKLPKPVFTSITELESCQFQFKLIATTGSAGTNVQTEKDPIAVFEDDDDSHLSVGFIRSSSSIRVALPPIDYFTSFSGTKSSTKAWANTQTNPQFELVLTIVRPGTLGTGAGQVLDHFDVVNAIMRTSDGHLYFGDTSHTLVYVTDVGTIVTTLGFIKGADLGSMASVDTPGNWAYMCKLSEANGRPTYGNKPLALAEDITVPFENEELLRSLYIDENGRMVFVKPPEEEGEDPVAVTLARLSDITEYTPPEWMTRIVESTETDTAKRKLSYNGKEILRKEDGSTAGSMTHTYVFTEVNKAKGQPDPNEIYWVSDGHGGYTKVNGTGHVESWDSSLTYYTRTADVRVDGSKILGVGSGGGGGSSIADEIVIDTDRPADYTRSGYGVWIIEDEFVEQLNKCGYTAYLEANSSDGTGSVMLNPIGNIAESEDYNPIYVPVQSLISVNPGYRNRLYIRIPLSWLDATGLMYDEEIGKLYLHIRKTPVEIGEMTVID